MDQLGTAEFDAAYKRTATVMIAVFIIVVILGILGWFYLPYTAVSGNRDLTALWVLVLFVAGGSFVLRRRLTGFERLRDKKLLGGTEGVIRVLQSNALIMAAVALLIGIAGAIASLLSGDGFDAVRASLVAVIILAINFPRRSVWDKIIALLQDV